MGIDRGSVRVFPAWTIDERCGAEQEVSDLGAAHGHGREAFQLFDLPNEYIDFNFFGIGRVSGADFIRGR